MGFFPPPTSAELCDMPHRRPRFACAHRHYLVAGWGPFRVLTRTSEQPKKRLLPEKPHHVSHRVPCMLGQKFGPVWIHKALCNPGAFSSCVTPDPSTTSVMSVWMCHFSASLTIASMPPSVTLLSVKLLSLSWFSSPHFILIPPTALVFPLMPHRNESKT